MSGKISQETDMIQKGIGEKIGEVWHTMIVLVLAYIISFTIGWEFTLINLGAIPVLMVGAIIMAKTAQLGTKEEMKAYQQCAGMAEQSLQAIKVVHTYGREDLESKNYNKYLLRVLQAAKTTNNLKSLGPTLF